MRRFLLVLALVACKKPEAAVIADAAPPAVEASVEAGPRAWPVWTAKITDDEELLHYSTEVGNERYLKLVVDMKSNATYYADADLYPMHKDFIFAEILKTPRTPEAVHEFDKNYGRDKPEFLRRFTSPTR